MARAWCWALVWWALEAAVAGSRYADYSGGKMPQYGGGPDYEGPRDSMVSAPPGDYADQLPDPPASPADYKYDDDSGKWDKVTFKDDEIGDWPKNSKKRQRPPRILDKDNLGPADRYTEEAISKFKPEHRAAHKARDKARHIDIDDNRIRHPVKNKHNRLHDSETEVKDVTNLHHDEIGRNKGLDLEDLESKDDRHSRHQEPLHDIDVKDDIHRHHAESPKRKDLSFDDDDLDKEFIYKTTTVRVNRRKPRDRFIKRQGDNNDAEEELWQKRLLSANKRISEYPSDIEKPNRRNLELPSENEKPNKRILEYPSDNEKPNSRNLEYPSENEKPNRRNLEYPLENEKLKAGRRRFESGFKENRDDIARDIGEPRKTFISSDEDTDKLQVLGKERDNKIFDDTDYNDDIQRIERMRERIPVLLRRTSPAWRTSAEARRLTRDPLGEVMPNRRAMVPFPKETTTGSPPTLSDTSTGTTETKNTTSSTTASPDDTFISSTDISDVLSLAEKSRLSILKKSQKKESEKGETTSKPVVLMQVTRQMHTLVMVEPPTSLKPWERAKVVSGDSSDRLKRVKRLMRQKIVENAKSMHDLTENWDEMVCDYIDVAMLDNSSNTNSINWFLILIVLVVLCRCNFYSIMF